MPMVGWGVAKRDRPAPSVSIRPAWSAPAGIHVRPPVVPVMPPCVTVPVAAAMARRRFASSEFSDFMPAKGDRSPVRWASAIGQM